MKELVDFANSILWDNVLVYLLSFCGIWFTFKLRAIQLRHFTLMFKLIFKNSPDSEKGISSFQALMISLAARVGTGNLAGVAIAISLGGPGAIFWMWLIALVGMATGYAESLLGQLYKVRDANNEFRGGPAYYIQHGLGKPVLALVFSLLIFMGYGFIFSSVQANTITDALNYSYQIETQYSAIVVVMLAAIILMGGLKTIAKTSSFLVPLMGVGYIVLALYICLVNLEHVPSILLLIVKSALGIEQAASGTLGAIIMNGIKRGLYSNEAGAGTVPHAAASATPYPNHPATQGYVQMLGVFVDTIVICTATAVIILLAGLGQKEQIEGIRLTQQAVNFHVGDVGSQFILIAICLFSFTSIIANYVYAESNLHLVKCDNKLGKFCFACLFLLTTFIGATSSLPQVWALADFSLGLTTLINVIVLVAMSSTIVMVTKDFHQQYKSGKTPEFKTSNSVTIHGKTSHDVW